MIVADSPEDRERIAVIDAHRLRLDLDAARHDLALALEDARLARVTRDVSAIASEQWRKRALEAEGAINGLAALFPSLVRAIREMA